MFASVNDGRIVLATVPTAADEPLLDRPERNEHRDDKNRCEHSGDVVAESDRHTHRRGDPDRGGGGQPVHVVTRPQNPARAEEADTGGLLAGAACRVPLSTNDEEQSP